MCTASNILNRPIVQSFMGFSFYATKPSNSVPAALLLIRMCSADDGGSLFGDGALLLAHTYVVAVLI